MLNDARIYQGVAEGIEPLLLSCIRMPEGHNTIFDSKDLNRRMMDAAIRDSSVGGCADAVRTTGGRAAAPSGRWCAGIIRRTEKDALQKGLCDTIRRQVGTLKKKGGSGISRITRKGMTVAIDMHLIPRYDKKPGSELTRSRHKQGTTYFERYMTAQCVDDGMPINLGAISLGMFDSVPESLHLLLESVKYARCKGEIITVGPRVFLDRNHRVAAKMWNTISDSLP